jgi:hypothetical protein
MTKEEKHRKRIENSIERRKKKKEINARKKQQAEDDLINCPFDVDMNNLYGTCTCGGVNRESCAMST